jgi:hypothetical protein
MESLPVSSVSVRPLGRLIAIALGVTSVAWPTVAMTQCITQLKDKAYVNLPPGLCPRYTDMLLGKAQQQVYGGVICDRPESSYILLQKLIKYTDRGKAVWQVLQIKQISRPTQQSAIKGIGCRQLQNKTQASEPIFALVQPTSTHNTYQTLAAWRVNLLEGSFTNLESKTVICQDPMI